MAGVAKDDHEEKDRRMQPIREEIASWKKDSVLYAKYAASRIKAAIHQFTVLVSPILILTGYR